MQMPQTLCARGCCWIVGAAARASHAQQIWNYANEEWDPRRPFVQANVHATCDSTVHGPRKAFHLLNRINPICMPFPGCIVPHWFHGLLPFTYPGGETGGDGVLTASGRSTAQPVTDQSSVTGADVTLLVALAH